MYVYFYLLLLSYSWLSSPTEASDVLTVDAGTTDETIPRQEHAE